MLKGARAAGMRARLLLSVCRASVQRRYLDAHKTAFVARLRHDMQALYFCDQVPDVDIVMGCGDAPCSNLPKPKQAGRRRRMQASAAGVAAGAAGTAADYLGSGGGDSVAAGGGGGSGSGGVAGGDVCRRRLDASGSLLPGCAGSGDGSSGSLKAGAVGGGPDGSDGSGNAAFPESGGGGAGKFEVGSSHSGADSNSSGSGGGSSGISRRRALTLRPDVPFPMFTYDTDENHADIPFPDFSYWGHEFDRLWGAAYVLK